MARERPEEVSTIGTIPIITLADIYVWITHNSWWLWMLVPFAIIIFIVRAASVR